VTVGNELPNATGQGAAGASPQDLAKKSEETVNYEISRTTKTETLDSGRIKRVSVAVLVDGTYSRDASGALVYAPRAKEDLDRISALVRSSIGYDQQRGDQLEVVNLRFAEAPPTIEAQADLGWMAYFTFAREDIMRMAELAVLAILSLLVLMFVVRPLVRRAVGPDMPGRLAQEALALPGSGAAVAGQADHGPAQKLALPRPEDNMTLQMLEVAQVNGDIQQKSVERVGELVDRNPSETLSLIRTWLNEPAN
jgi:flagellar M-ring protein FliF